MYDLLTRTISQGLQAFLPIAFCLTWFRRAEDTDAVSGLRWGVLAAVPLTAGMGYLFQSASKQAQWEAALAGVALALAILFARRVWPGLPSWTTEFTARRRQGYRLAFGLAAAVIVARQTMEIAIVLATALQLRSLDALLAVSGGAATAVVVAVLWLIIGRRLPSPALSTATNVFAWMFAGQVAMYAFHESAEAGLLPWSEVLHAATEPYGPDGMYGRYVSAFVFLIPLAAGVGTLVTARLPQRTGVNRGRRSMAVLKAAVGIAVIAAAGAVAVRAINGDRVASYATADAAPAALHDTATIARSPHLLFRHTATDPNYSRLSVAPLDARSTADRAAAEFACERVSYAAGRGICLQAERGLFTSYKALFFDSALKATRSIKLAGSPSRTRISSDGRVGAITVFVTGQAHGYTSSTFSTKTTILDMASGDELGDLEQFSTWRDGARFKNADFNFWGVTFARDSNVFYATLRTAGSSNRPTTFLVRGDLGLRKLTVLKENVECPSLSPDNRLIAFKKRVGSDLAPWRLYVLDVATLTERPIAGETRSIDDQMEWLDDAHVLYAASRSSQLANRDVWVAPLDNSEPAKVFARDAESPIVVR